ncbi:MAG: HEAT repeat domain-containing protein, partial [Myxococcota bacterium]
MIFLPVPSATKKTAKLFLDTTIDASATGLGALLVVALTGPFGLDITQVSFVAVGLITLTIAIAPRMRRAYVDAFRAALERRSLDMSALTTHLSEAAVVNGLLRALSGDNPRQVLYALDLLTSAKSPGIVEAVRPLLAHPSAEVRFRALEVLLAQKSTLPPDALTPLLQDESEAVRRAAMQALSAQEGTDRRAFLQQQLDGDDDLRRAAALGCIALRPAGVAEPLLTADRTASLLAQAEMPESLRAQLLAAIAVHPNPNIAPDVLNALPHESSVIQKTVIEAMGRSRQARHISFLVDRLNDRKLRRECRRSLARFGDIIVPHVLNELDNGARTPQQRQALVRVLEDVGTQAASDALLAHLTSPFPAQYRAVVRSLSRIRHTQPDLVFTKDTVHRAVLADVEWYYDLTRLAASVGEGSTASDRLLGRALEEKRRLTLENIFSLLGLRHPP